MYSHQIKTQHTKFSIKNSIFSANYSGVCSMQHLLKPEIVSSPLHELFVTYRPVPSNRSKINVNILLSETVY